MKNYRELADKIVKDLQRRHFINSQSEQVAKILSRNIDEMLTDHFKPDGELVERALDYVIQNCDKYNEDDAYNIDLRVEVFRDMLASFHLQESALQNLFDQAQELDMGYGNPTPIDDKGIAERAKSFYQRNSFKYITQPAGTWDMLADFAISELSRLPLPEPPKPKQ